MRGRVSPFVSTRRTLKGFAVNTIPGLAGSYMDACPVGVTADGPVDWLAGRRLITLNLLNAAFGFPFQRALLSSSSLYVASWQWLDRQPHDGWGAVCHITAPSLSTPKTSDTVVTNCCMPSR